MSGRWDAYVWAEIRIAAPGGPVLVYGAPVAQATGRYPDPEGRPIAVITAHNPGGQLADPAKNAAAQSLLQAELDARGMAWWPAAGANHEWTHVEESVAVPGMSEADALVLGGQFGQEAVFLLTRTSRKVIDCGTGAISMTGWHIEPDTADADYPDEHAHEDHQDGAPPVTVTVYPDPVSVDGVPGLVLAESRWDADDDSDEDDGCLSPGGSGESGAEYLLRVGPGYVIYETNGAESDSSDLVADSDRAAIAAFRSYLGVPE